MFGFHGAAGHFSYDRQSCRSNNGFLLIGPGGSETARRMCSVRIMWHQSLRFNHNTWRAVTHTAPPRATPTPTNKDNCFSRPRLLVPNRDIKIAGVNISNNSLSPPLSTSAKNLEAKGNGRISLSKLCAGSHREWKRGKLQPDL